MIDESELAAYTERVIKEEFVFAEPFADPELLEHLRMHTRRALMRLNTLSSSDPFWVNSNRRPTASKVHKWSRKRLVHHPEDHEARWALFSSMLSSGPHGYVEVFAPLVHSDPGSVRWLVNAAELVSNIWGLDQADELRWGLTRELPGLLKDGI